MTHWANGWFAHAGHYFEYDNGLQTTSSSRKDFKCNNTQPRLSPTKKSFSLLLRRSVSSMFFTRIWKTNIYTDRGCSNSQRTGGKIELLVTSGRKGIKQFENAFLEACFLHAQKGGEGPLHQRLLSRPSLATIPTTASTWKWNQTQKGFLVISLLVTLFLFWERKKYSNRTREN